MSGWARVPAHRRVTVCDLHCIVDGFKYAGPHCSQYFLTHYHADHYGGLTDAFSFGSIHCSPITARLLPNLGVARAHIVAHDYDAPFVLDGVQVTLTEANHCPGAVLILFQPLAPAPLPSPSPSKRLKADPSLPSSPPLAPLLSGPSTLLHTGDFRWSDSMRSHPTLCSFRPDTVYLDTTYSSPSFCFPLQADSIAHLLRCVLPHLATPSTLFALSTYVIGKEKIFRAIARALRVLLYVPPRKYRILQSIGERMDSFTTEPRATRFHIVGWSALGETWPYFKPNFRNADVYLNQLNDGRLSEADDEADHVDAGDAIDVPMSSPPPLPLPVDEEDTEEFPFVTDEHRRMARVTAERYNAVVGFVPTGWVHSKTAAFPPSVRRKVDGGHFGGGARRRSAKVKQAEEEAKTIRKLTTTHIAVGGSDDSSDEQTDDGPAADLQTNTAPTATADSALPTSSAGALAPHVLYLVPYSEHSSFAELQACVRFFRPRVIVPTVFSDAKHVSKIIATFSGAIDRTANVRTFLQRHFTAPTAEIEAVTSEATDSAEQDEVSLPITHSVSTVETRRSVVEHTDVITVSDEDDDGLSPGRVQSVEGSAAVAGLPWFCHECQKSWQEASQASPTPNCPHCSSAFVEQRAAAGPRGAAASPSSPAAPTASASTAVSARTPASTSLSPRSRDEERKATKKGAAKQLSLSAFFQAR